jgi:transposase-like protein
MDTHKNARLTPKGREEMVRAVVDGGQNYAAAAREFNTTPKTVAKWVKRFRAEGMDGLRDRSSRPLSSDSQTPQATCDAIEVLRRQRYSGKQIAVEVGGSPATVCRVLKSVGSTSSAPWSRLSQSGVTNVRNRASSSISISKSSAGSAQ